MGHMKLEQHSDTQGDVQTLFSYVFLIFDV